MAGDFVFRETCPACKGKRWVGSLVCKGCNGTGQVDRPAK